VTAEGCSEAPGGCDKCCDTRWEGRSDEPPSTPVTTVEDLALVR
jgi:hypothetical protein